MEICRHQTQEICVLLWDLAGNLIQQVHFSEEETLLYFSLRIFLMPVQSQFLTIHSPVLSGGSRSQTLHQQHLV